MKVLLVEDHAQTCALITQFLERHQYTVDKASDGDEAFQKAKTHTYDILILDMMLPSKSGFDIIKELRALNIQNPILGISALQLAEDRIKALEAGADDFLVKNFALPELLTRIKCLCRRRVQNSTSLLQCSDLSVNFEDRTVHRDGKSLYLAKKEFELLAELLRHKNKVLSHEHLWNNIWKDTPVSSSLTNTISVHLRFLRAKIDDPFPKRLIHTIRGHGYMISEQKS